MARGCVGRSYCRRKATRREVEVECSASTDPVDDTDALVVVVRVEGSAVVLPPSPSATPFAFCCSSFGGGGDDDEDDDDDDDDDDGGGDGDDPKWRSKKDIWYGSISSDSE